MWRWMRRPRAQASLVFNTASSTPIGNRTRAFRDRSSSKARVTSSSTQSLAMECSERISSSLSRSRIASSMASQVLAPIGRSWVGSIAKCESPTFAGVCTSETPLARIHRQLDLDQRRTLFRLVEARTPVGEIAARLGRHPSTIHRELGRNRFRDGDRGFCGYFPLNARDLARRRRQRRRKLAADEGLRAHVTERLEAGWSPQRIAGRLRHEADGGPTVCHETIYRHVYGPEGRRDGLYRHRQ